MSRVYSTAMSFYSVSFIHEGIEECVEGMLALGHQRGLSADSIIRAMRTGTGTGTTPPPTANVNVNANVNVRE